MQINFLRSAEQYLKKYYRQRVWRKIVQGMACVVVFCTTYALILPAITMEKTVCGLEEHSHSDSCYRKVIAESVTSLVCDYESLGVHVHSADCYYGENNIVCGHADFLVHDHNGDCVDENGNLVCQLPVVGEHIHTDACYSVPKTPEPTETTPAHFHVEDCYTTERGELICEKDETEGHSHGDSCYTQGELQCQLAVQEAHTHGEGCSETVQICELTVEPHQHNDDCYQQLVCELPEDENHTHTEACNGKVLNCDLTEQPHNHGENCFRTNMLCDLPETEGHAHGHDCYVWNLECELDEEEAHAHTDECYEAITRLSCGLEEGVTVETGAGETAEPETPEPQLVCGKEVIRIHSHNAETCYEIDQSSGEKRLICSETVVLEHIHGESCFVTEEVPAEDVDKLTCTLTEGHTHEDSCYEESSILTCTKVENHTHAEGCYEASRVLICKEAENHTHGDLCYGTWELICGKEEHAHTDACKEADSEEETTVQEETEEPALIKSAAKNTASGITYVEGPHQIGDSGVTWGVYKNDDEEDVLRFDGTGSIPNFDENATNRDWLNHISGKYVHLEFGPNVIAVGNWALKKANITSISWGGVKTIGEYAFNGGSGPTNLVFPANTVETIGICAFGGRIISSFELHNGLITLTRECFSAGDNTSTINIPATVTTIDGPLRAKVSAYTVDPNNEHFCAVDGVLFTKDMTTLIDAPRGMRVAEYRIPEGVKKVGYYSFSYIGGMGRLVIPPSVEVLESRILQGTNINEIYIEDGSKLREVGQPIINVSSGLTNIRYPEDTAIKLFPMFWITDASILSNYTHFTVPNKITSIGKLHGNLLNLETVTYKAENATFEDNATSIFESCSQYNLIIEHQVNHLPPKFSLFATNAKTFSFRGENTFTAESGAFAGAGEPLEDLFGTFFVDSNGILYQCEDNTAKVVYASMDVPESVTIPAKVKTDDGAEYAVTAVGENAFGSAQKLSTLTFEAPGQITSLGDKAMANCPTLKRVNGNTTVEDAEAIFDNQNVQKGTDLFRDSGLIRYSGDSDGNGILDGTGMKNPTVDFQDATLNFVIGSSAGTMEWIGDEDGNAGYYQLLTGDVLNITASAGNMVGSEEYVYRIYFRTTASDATLSFTPGKPMTFTYNDTVYTVNTYKTSDPNTSYLEFELGIAETLGVPISVNYPNVVSDGGGVEIWGEIRRNGDSGEETGTGKVIQAQWITKRHEMVLTKVGGTPVTSIVSNGNSGGKPGGNLNWTINLEQSKDPVLNYGKDYAESAVFTDIITLPEDVTWNSRLEEAVKSGKVKFLSNDLFFGDVKAATIKLGKTNVSMMNVEAFWHEEKDTIAIRWKLNNTSQEDMDASQIQFTIYPEAIDIDITKIVGFKEYTVTNEVSADVTYQYSGTYPYEASAENKISGGNAVVELSKSSAPAPKFFGEDIKYTLDLYNKGAFPYVANKDTVLTMVDGMSRYTYIKPENMLRMFQDEHGRNLTIYIANAAIGQWVGVTGVDGHDAYMNTGNSNLGTTGHAVEIALTKNNNNEDVYRVIVDKGTTYYGSTPAEALQAAGYAVTAADSYRCYWVVSDPNKDFILDANTHKYMYLYATVKDSFRIIEKDWPNEYAGAEDLSITNFCTLYAGDTKVDNNAVVRAPGITDKVKREVWVDKSVYKDGVLQANSADVVDGDVLTYHLNTGHRGSGSYKNLPLVDDLYGSQYLLVPVDGNSGTQFTGLDQYTDDGIPYYILTEGDYTDVRVGLDGAGNPLIAASISVEMATDDVQVDLGGVKKTYSGLHTEIKWYFPQVQEVFVKYKALVDMDAGGKMYSIGNAVWVNDRDNTRIYDFIWGTGTLIDFTKDIVVQKGSTTYSSDIIDEDDYSKINAGDSVTYRIALHNTNNHSFLLEGINMGDALPETYNVFDWNATNVKFEGVQVDNASIQHKNLDKWEISDKFAGIAGEHRWFIVWPEHADAEIKFNEESTLYLYFTLTYPSGDLWDQYVAAAGGSKIFNTVYIYRYPSSVEHNLMESGKVLLHKGVSGMYHYKDHLENWPYLVSGTSRREYNNRDYHRRAIMYHVTLYNGGTKRLYVEDMYDQLPKGFTFIEMINNSPKGKDVDPTKNTVHTTGGNSNNIARIDIGSVVYRSAKVQAEAWANNRIHFKISAGTGTNPLRYDEQRQKYYLNKGEAIVFAYVCDIGAAANTLDSSVNTIAMPYDDYLDSDLDMIQPIEIPVNTLISDGFLNTNEGTRAKKTRQEIENQYNFTERDEAWWLVSEVEVRRGTIKPGVIKYTDSYIPSGSDQSIPYTNNVTPYDTVTWMVRMRNKGSSALVDYTIKDTMQKPYTFEGTITLNIYDVNGNFIRDRVIGVILPREDPAKPPTLLLKPGGTDTVEIPRTGEWVDLTLGAGYLRIAVSVDEAGNEVLSIDCSTPDLAIPEGGHADLYLSTKNRSGQYDMVPFENNAGLYPNVQQFESACDGNIVYNEAGVPIGVEDDSHANVTFGYATSAVKRVTEDDKTAVSSDLSNNRIVLTGENSTFTYNLTVGNDTKMAMNKLVIIDNLPQIGDHSPFNTKSPRNSEFEVVFESDPVIQVINKDGKPVDIEDQYTVEFTTLTEFGDVKSDDWQGNPDSKWSTTRTSGSRAFRIIIQAKDGKTPIPAESQIHVSFQAKAGADADPGEIAWNSFGYYYVLDRASSGEGALTWPVGVSIPSVPTLTKMLVDRDGEFVQAEEDLTFRFVVYKGTDIATTPETIIQDLTARSIPFIEKTITVKQGNSQSDKVYLEEPGFWVDGQTYTVMEISCDDEFDYLEINETDTRQVSFLYDKGEKVDIICKNQLKRWDLKLTKTDAVDGKLLPGAVFGLYSPTEDGALTEAEAAQWGSDRTIPLLNDTWYLKYVGRTDEKGGLLWEELPEDRYYLLEVKAPDGYNLPEAGQYVQPGADKSVLVTLTVTNSPGYELPDTGGAGTTSYTLGGLLLITAAILLYIHTFKRRKEDYASF